jgi:hypothetical protein
VGDCAKTRRDAGLIDFKYTEASMIGLYSRGIIGIGEREFSGVKKSAFIRWIRQKD